MSLCQRPVLDLFQKSSDACSVKEMRPEEREGADQKLCYRNLRATQEDEAGEEEGVADAWQREASSGGGHELSF